MAGYAAVQQVMAPGEFCVRGGLVDLFPTGSAVPYRLDLLGDEIESIRTFDVDSQRSIYPVNEVRLLPAREFPHGRRGPRALPGELPGALRGRPHEAARLQGRLERHRAPGRGVLPAPLLRDDLHALRLPAGGRHLRACTRTCRPVPRNSGATCASRWELLRGDSDRPLLPPDQLYLSAESFFVALQDLPRLDVKRGARGPMPLGTPAFAPEDLPDIGVDRRAGRAAARPRALRGLVRRSRRPRRRGAGPSRDARAIPCRARDARRARRRPGRTARNRRRRSSLRTGRSRTASRSPPSAWRWSPRRSSTRRRSASRGAATRAARRAQRVCCATWRRSRKATPSSTASTASAATAGW